MVVVVKYGKDRHSPQSSMVAGIDAVLLAKLQPMRKSRNFNAHVHLNTCSTSNDARFHDPVPAVQINCTHR